MTLATYQLELYDPTGTVRLGFLPRFSSLEYARKTNDVGSLRLTIDSAFVPAAALDANQRIRRDLRLAVYRSPQPGAALALDADTVWFIRGTKRIRKQNGATLEIRAVDAVHLLKRRIIASAAGTAGALKTGAADNIIKQFAREALGSSAIVARQMAGVAVDGNVSLGPSITKAGAWRNLLDVMQEIADDAAQQTTPTAIYFDLAATSVSSLLLRTYIGQRGLDRTLTMPVGADYGNLANEETDYDTEDEVTYAYCGGQGEGALRAISEQSDAVRASLSPYNRIEVFVDSRNTDSAAALPGEARAAVRAGRPRFMFNGSLVSVPGSRYGIDFAFGDKVRAQSGNDSFDCRIDAIRINVDSSGETIDAKLWSAD